MDRRGRSMRGPDTPKGGRRAKRSNLPAKHTTTTADRSETKARTKKSTAGPPGRGPQRLYRPLGRRISNWSVSTRLVALFVAASLMGLIFGGLRVADAISAANG